MAKKLAPWLLHAFFLTLTLSESVGAEPVVGYKNETEALSALSALERDKAQSSGDRLSEIDRILSHSQQMDWTEASLYASLLHIEQLLSTGNMARARSAYDQSSKAGIASQRSGLSIRFKLADMQLRQAEGDLGDAQELYAELAADAAGTGDLALSARVLLVVGESQYTQGLYAEAVLSSMAAFEILDRTDDASRKAEVFALLGNIHADQGQYEKAIEYFHRTLEFAEQAGDELLKSVAYFNYGLALKNIRRFPEAREEMSRAARASENIGDEVGRVYATLGIAFIEMELEQWRRALTLFEESVPAVVASGDEVLYLNTLLGIVKSSAKLGNFNEAEKKLFESASILESLNKSLIHVNFLKVAIDLYAQQENYERAFFYLQKKADLEAEFSQELKEKEFQDIQVKYDTQLLERRNENLLVQNQLQALKLTENDKNAKLRRQTSFLGAVLLIILVVFAWIQVRNRNRFKAMANRDFLTNAPNRRAVLEYANSLFHQTKRHDLPLFLAVVDLDNFKSFNDRHGHDMGDEVLRGFARACEGTLRKEDGFGRYGGEEWLLVLPGIGEAQVEAVFGRLKSALNDTHIADILEAGSVTFSMGAAAVDTIKDENVESVIGRADALLYRAKEQGRDQLVVEK